MRFATRIALFSLLAVLLASPTRARSQNLGLVIRDGSLGGAPAGVVPPGVDPEGQYADYLVTEDLGERAGPNLFHSFSDFGTGTGETATFTGSPAVENVISRVTGGNPSELDGRLRSTIPGADVYLLNPSGVLFGSDAQLDVKGSFHVSTAASLEFPNGEVFEARNGGTVPVLAVASPSAFGFLGDSASQVVVDGSTLQNHHAISLSGGAVTVRNGGVVRTHATQTRAGGDISIKGAESVNVTQARVETETGGPAAAGRIAIEAPVVLLDERSFVTSTSTGAGHGDAGSVSIAAPDALTVRASHVQTSTNGEGDAGNVELSASDVVVTSEKEGDPEFASGSSVTTRSGGGRAGRIAISAERSLTLSGAGPLRGSGVLVVSTYNTGGGDRGRIDITAPIVMIEDGALVGVSSFFDTTPAGDISIAADESVTVLGSLVLTSRDRSDPGEVSRVDIEAPVIVIGCSSFNCSVIGSEASTGAPGVVGVDAGEVVITATESVAVVGTRISADSGGGGDAGRVTIEAPVVLIDGGGITSQAR